ncbi:type II secretion system protein [Patescibacteria group bacterium]
MRKIFQKIRLGGGSGGFTMIELLVVIAVIGVLAVAVLSSINPVEQINKGRDTRVRSNAAQLLNAIDRYYAIHEIYPWNDFSYGGGDTADTLPTEELPGAATTACLTTNGFCQIGGAGYSAHSPWLAALTSTEEVKESFINQIENIRPTNATYVFKRDAADANTDDSVYICFTPSSSAFEQEAVDGCEARYAELPTNACPNSPGATTYVDELICLP